MVASMVEQRRDSKKEALNEQLKKGLLIKVLAKLDEPDQQRVRAYLQEGLQVPDVKKNP